MQENDVAENELKSDIDVVEEKENSADLKENENNFKLIDVFDLLPLKCVSKSYILDNETLKKHHFYLTATKVYKCEELDAKRAETADSFSALIDEIVEKLYKRYDFVKTNSELAKFNLKYALMFKLLHEESAEKWDIFLLFATFNPLQSAHFIFYKDDLNLMLANKLPNLKENWLFNDFITYLSMFFVNKPENALFFKQKTLKNDLYLEISAFENILLAPAGTVLPFESAVSVNVNEKTALNLKLSDYENEYFAGKLNVAGELNVNLKVGEQVEFTLNASKYTLKDANLASDDVEFKYDTRWIFKNAGFVLSAFKETLYTFSESLDNAIAKEQFNEITIAFELMSLANFNLTAKEKINLRPYSYLNETKIGKDNDWDVSYFLRNYDEKVAKKMWKKYRSRIKQYRRHLFFSFWQKKKVE